MFGAMAYFFLSSENIGQKLLAVWIPIVACIPIFWMFGEPMSRGRSSER
jgi:hypothetical protein